MVDRLDRRAWKAAVRGAAWPTTARPMRSTALELAELMKADGTLSMLRPVVAERLGIPPRTLTHHLTWLVENRWLKRTVRGGNGRLSVYVTWHPGMPLDEDLPVSCEQRVAHNSGSCGQSTGTQLGEVVGKLVARSVKTSHRASDVHALDPDRERQADHDGPYEAPPSGALVAQTLARYLPHPIPTQPQPDKASEAQPQPVGASQPASRPLTKRNRRALRYPGVRGCGFAPPKRDARAQRERPSARPRRQVVTGPDHSPARGQARGRAGAARQRAPDRCAVRLGPSSAQGAQTRAPRTPRVPETPETCEVGR